MHWVAVVAVLGMAVLVERVWVLGVRERSGGRTLFLRVRGRLLLEDTQGALQLCAGPGAVARVMHAGLMAGVDRTRAQGRVREVQLGCMPRLTQRIGVLSSLAGLAALCGLLGTIDGMTGGTHCVATVSADQRAAALAMEIAAALNTTGFGILVAIVLRSAALFLQTRRDRLVCEIELYGAAVVNLVGIVTEPHERTHASLYRGVTP